MLGVVKCLVANLSGLIELSHHQEVKGYKMSRCELSGLIELSHHQKLKVIKCLVAN